MRHRGQITADAIVQLPDGNPPQSTGVIEEIIDIALAFDAQYFALQLQDGGQIVEPGSPYLAASQAWVSKSLARHRDRHILIEGIRGKSPALVKRIGIQVQRAGKQTNR
ncbi:hypothetical protein D3C75_871820 [compost metagenome]